MTTRIRTFALFALAAAVLVAGLPAAAQDTGSADFSRFVALGDSLGAGFVSGGLVRGAQEDSVPALIARQATGMQISQPLVSEPGLPPLMRLVSLSPLQIVTLPGRGNPVVAPPYQNLSVPGYRVGDAIRDRDRGPTDLASFILANEVVTTQLEWALLQQPTFAMVWLGNNDVLAAATSGIVIDGVTLTPVAQFEADYMTIVGALKGVGADLVLANLPDVTSIPFVTTIPPVLVNPATQQPVLGPGGNPIPLLGVNEVPLSPGDRVLLTASTRLSMGIGIPAFAGGTGVGLENEDYLTVAEVNAIQNRVNAYNAIIRETATQTGSALADINALLRTVATDGYNIGGITFTEDFVTGGTFSLDGVHPQPLGYAVAANTFIDAINDTYDADIPLVDLFPFLFGSDASAIPSIPGALVGEIVYTQEARDQLLEVLRVWKPSTPADDRPGKGEGKPTPSREGIRVPFRPGG
jgi:hypothetical protein